MNSGNLNSSVRVYGFSQPDLEMQQPDLELRYADLELQEPNLKLWKPDVELHDLQGVSNWDEIDAYCECGAGTFLGLIRGVSGKRYLGNNSYLPTFCLCIRLSFRCCKKVCCSLCARLLTWQLLYVS